jgi:hypothetical protein
MALDEVAGNLLEVLQKAKKAYDHDLKVNRIDLEDIGAAIAAGREAELKQDEDESADMARAHDDAVVMLRSHLISTNRAEAAATVQEYADIPSRDFERRDAAFTRIEGVLQAG